MRNNFGLRAFTSLILLFYSSCRKERDLLSALGGKVWVLQSGRIYAEDLDAPYNKRYYDHFGVGTSQSNLQAFYSISLGIVFNSTLHQLKC